jgi:hypothetical protein
LDTEYNIVIEPYFHFEVRPLSEFPPEIRNNVYRLLFSGTKVGVRHLTLKSAQTSAEICFDAADGHNSGWFEEKPFDIQTSRRLNYGCCTNDGVKDILNTCRSIRKEARPMLYGVALWDICDPALIDPFAKEAARGEVLDCIKHLRIDYMVNSDVKWRRRFPGLKVLILSHDKDVPRLEKVPSEHTTEALWNRIVETDNLRKLFTSDEGHGLHVVLKVRWSSGTGMGRLDKEDQCLIDVDNKIITPTSGWFD